MTDSLTELLRRLTALEQEVSQQAAQLQLYEILHSQSVNLTANQTAWDIPDADVIELYSTSTGTFYVYGIANGERGRILRINNQSTTSFALVLVRESVLASALNRIRTTSASADITLDPGDSAELVYTYIQQSDTYRWRVMSYTQ